MLLLTILVAQMGLTYHTNETPTLAAQPVICNTQATEDCFTLFYTKQVLPTRVEFFVKYEVTEKYYLLTNQQTE